MTQFVKMFIITAHPLFSFWVELLAQPMRPSDLIRKGIHVFSQNFSEFFECLHDFLLYVFGIELTVICELVVKHLSRVGPVFRVVATHLLEDVLEDG